jgi:hypothetical protein
VSAPSSAGGGLAGPGALPRFGLLAAVQSFGNLAASGIAVLLWTVLFPGVAFAYLAAWMFVALVGFARTRAPTPDRPKPIPPPAFQNVTSKHFGQ